METKDHNKQKLIASRKRKSKHTSEVDEELKKISESDNPFKMASELEESHTKKMKCAADIKKMHRRMRLLYNNASLLINQQRKERFGTKARLRAVRNKANNNNNSMRDIDGDDNLGYRVPCITEAEELSLLIGRLWISSQLEQAAPAANSVDNDLQMIAHRLRNASLRESIIERREEDDNDERPPLKKQRRSID